MGNRTFYKINTKPLKGEAQIVCISFLNCIGLVVPSWEKATMIVRLVLISVLVSTTSSELPTKIFSCMDGPLDGFYCSNNLSSYHICKKIASNFGKISCPVGTRCICGINVKCHVLEKDICQTIPPVMTPPESFEYSYIEQHIKLPTRTKSADYVVHVMWEAVAEMLTIKWMDKLTNVNHFEIIKPQGGKYAVVREVKFFIILLLSVKIWSE